MKYLKYLFLIALFIPFTEVKADRQYSTGFENASTTLESENAALESLPTFSNTTVHGGTYSMRTSSLSSTLSQGFAFRFSGGSSTSTIRFYLNVAQMPSNNNTIFDLCSNDVSPCGSSPRAWIKLTPAGYLQVGAGALASGAMGTSSVPINTGQWYRVELYAARIAIGDINTYTLRIDGTEVFTTNTGASGGTWRTFHIGGNLGGENQTQGDWFFDDVAVNNAVGTSQNSWPGEGYIVHLRPNATGEFSEPAESGAGTDWEALDDFSDYDTTYTALETNSASWAGAGSRLMMNVESLADKGVTNATGFNVVHVGAIKRSLTTGNSGSVTAIQTSNGGTRTEGVPNTYGTAVWGFMDDGVGSEANYDFSAHTDPDGAAWTVSTIDSLQIGIRTTDATPDHLVTSMWALVEYTTDGGGGGASQTHNPFIQLWGLLNFNGYLSF